MPTTDARRWCQFTMRDLLITICLAAITLVVVPRAPCFGVTAAGSSLFAAFALPRVKHGRRSLILMRVPLAVLVPVEFGCGLLCCHLLAIPGLRVGDSDSTRTHRVSHKKAKLMGYWGRKCGVAPEMC